MDGFKQPGAHRLVGWQHLWDGGEGGILIEQQAEILFAHDTLEFVERNAAVLGANLQQFVEGAFVHSWSGHADVDQAANCRFARAACGN